MLADAAARKARLKAGERSKPLEGKVLAMIFDKPSTRTRVSFDVGMRQLGGETIMLTGTEMQLGRSETIADTARVLSRYVDAIMIRTTAHSRLLRADRACHRSGDQRAHRRHPSVPADGRHHDLRGASRRGGRQDLRLDRRRQQRAALAARGLRPLPLQAQRRGAGRQRAAAAICRLVEEERRHRHLQRHRGSGRQRGRLRRHRQLGVDGPGASAPAATTSSCPIRSTRR